MKITSVLISFVCILLIIGLHIATQNKIKKYEENVYEIVSLYDELIEIKDMTIYELDSLNTILIVENDSLASENKKSINKFQTVLTTYAERTGITVLEAAGVFSLNNFDCLPLNESRHRWEWDIADSGTFTVEYEVYFEGTSFVTRNEFEMWMMKPFHYTIMVRGIDQFGNVSDWSIPGEVEKP